MTILRRASLTLLWILAGIGALCGLVWGATSAGIIKPLIVISGSMEPQIMTGDLLVATLVDAETLQVGDVVSLRSELTGDLVTHRIEAIAPAQRGAFTVTMKGDNNEFSDALDYAVSGTVWKPAVQLSGWGIGISRMMSPAVALPLLLGLLALLGLSLLPPVPPRRSHRMSRS